MKKITIWAMIHKNITNWFTRAKVRRGRTAWQNNPANAGMSHVACQALFLETAYTEKWNDGPRGGMR